MRCKYGFDFAQLNAISAQFDLIVQAIERFRAWQRDNPDKVRVPDSERSKAWLGC